MAHPKDEDVYPVETVVRLIETNEFAIIKGYTWLRPELQKFFLNYLAQIEGRGTKLWCLMHDRVELECLPKELVEK